MYAYALCEAVVVGVNAHQERLPQVRWVALIERLCGCVRRVRDAGQRGELVARTQRRELSE